MIMDLNYEIDKKQKEILAKVEQLKYIDEALKECGMSQHYMIKYKKNAEFVNLMNLQSQLVELQIKNYNQLFI